MPKRSTRKKPSSVLLNDRDREIFRHLGRARCLDTEQIRALVAPDLAPTTKAIVARLRKLREAGFVQALQNQQRLRQDPETGQRLGQVRMAYALTEKGAEMLGDESLASVGWTKNNRTIQNHHIAHELMIAGVYVSLELALRQISNVKLQEWYQGRAIWDHFYVNRHDGQLVAHPTPAQVTDGVVKRCPVRPDAYFLLHRRDRNADMVFFLEADQSTMPQERFVEKIGNYLRWQRHGLFEKRHGYRTFRVLTVAKANRGAGPQRRDTLRQAVAGFLQRHKLEAYAEWFRFAKEDEYLSVPGGIVKPVWLQPGRAKRFRLLESD